MKAEKDDPRSISREQSLALAASVPIGRVVYTDQALPAVIPMNFVLDGDEVVIHIESGSTLAAAIPNAVVAFQVDDFDSDTTTGWTVTITGQARLVDGGEERTRLARLPLRPWVPTKNGRFIRIPARHVAGHRLGPARTDTLDEVVAQGQMP
ncbi:pyridoxamine 5'-phosphate oxidase family protein [Actinoallomurus bryophytorum]|uniref:Pyridoxamine 5'-phosphate oxidase-like protein n=1 Tax=Actinoallomurus bryophytorum TaxID=1490222 RepID=A0A543CUL0_9ACTN|nr:pyridoxamine 5'-phosphate oxidase family protein [Actinoallomurus bryophytorum]TQM00802.1 pyridoxamine 5'-phosphate oxidase-like protein [Actinoallomurus bryophytorum]